MLFRHNWSSTNVQEVLIEKRHAHFERMRHRRFVSALAVGRRQETDASNALGDKSVVGGCIVEVEIATEDLKRSEILTSFCESHNLICSLTA